MRAKRYHINRQALAGDFVLGIDPGKEHSGVVIDPTGLPMGAAFTFPVTRSGYDEVVSSQLDRRIPVHGAHDLVVAIETSCNLCLTIAHHFDALGYRVVLVSPVATRHARPMFDNDYSKTDPKDALLIADNAQKGSYTHYRVFEEHIEAAHQLTRGPERFTHFKAIEKLAGSNVRISDSGKFKGRRRISKMGNPRLRRVVYQMTTQTAKVVPQVRRRFLERELRKKCYRKNIVASSSQLLRLIVALTKERRSYEERPDLEAHLEGLERKYEARYKKQRRARSNPCRRLRLISFFDRPNRNRRCSHSTTGCRTSPPHRWLGTARRQPLDEDLLVALANRSASLPLFLDRIRKCVKIGPRQGRPRT